jgi:nucleotide-binding universal stress UspA family protein/quercetin dioxygenase-like cupin family protein
MRRIHTILHPTDFSENARNAFDTACDAARDHKAALIVLHVMAPPVAAILSHPPPDSRLSAESQRPQARFPWPRPSDPQIHLEHRLAEGNPAEEILHLAAIVPCDLIVMGTHGKSGLARFLTGSVAEEVLRRAVCPVLVVKVPLPVASEVETESTAAPGELVDVRPLGAALSSARTRTLVHTTKARVVRVIVHAGQQIAEQESKGETVVHCLEGRVTLTALGKTETLAAGQLLHFPAGQSYSFEGIEDASVLVTTLLPGPRHA